MAIPEKKADPVKQPLGHKGAKVRSAKTSGLSPNYNSGFYAAGSGPLMEDEPDNQEEQNG